MLLTDNRSMELQKLIILLLFLHTISYSRINGERELKRLSRPFGKVLKDVSKGVNDLIFNPNKRLNYVKANSFSQINVAKGRMGHTQLGAALPHRAALNRRILVYYPPTGKVVRVQVRDVGPWNSRDSYWSENRRPLAETEESNSVGLPIPYHSRAGISLTPQTWYKLGVRRDVAFTGDFNGIVGWKFVNLKRSAPMGNFPTNETEDPDWLW